MRRTDLDLVAVDDLIQRASAAGLVLAPCRDLVGDGMGIGHRIAEIIDLLDALVSDVRQATFMQGRNGGDRRALEAAEPSNTLQDATVIRDQLRRTAEALRSLAARCATTGGEPMQLGEAEHGVRRAVVVLSDDLLAERV